MPAVPLLAGLRHDRGRGNPYRKQAMRAVLTRDALGVVMQHMTETGRRRRRHSRGEHRDADYKKTSSARGTGRVLLAAGRRNPEAARGFLTQRTAKPFLPQGDEHVARLSK
jgi:hypothetical protein